MKLIISPVENATIIIENKIKREIGKGLLVYFGVSKQDCELTEEEINQKIEKVSNKLQSLQFFVGKDGKINTSLKDFGGEILLISNFTLYGKNKKGNKIDFLDSGNFQKSKNIYDLLVEKLLQDDVKVSTGEFGAYMEVESKNNGPLNYVLEF